MLRLFYLYVAAIATYSVARIPIGILLVTHDTMSNGSHRTIAWAMRHVDPFVYFPFTLMFSDAMKEIERSDLFFYLVVVYLCGAVCLVMILTIVAVFKWIYELMVTLNDN